MRSRREGGVEALTGERAGPGIEPRKAIYSGRRRVEVAEGRIGCTEIASVPESRGQRPRART